MSIGKRCVRGVKRSSILWDEQVRMGTPHFQMKTLKRVATEMALHVLAYNLKRVINILGTNQLMAAMRA